MERHRPNLANRRRPASSTPPAKQTARHNGRVSDEAETTHGRPLREQDALADPIEQFAAWYRDAESAGLRLPEAVALATATPDGAPSLRMVLTKGFDERGFSFFSNYSSRKGQELAANPRAALLFHWDPLGRQVRITGPVQRTSPEETAAYVRSRPHRSRLSALASPQSQVVEDRAVLEQAVAALEREHRGGELPLPEDWGGFRLSPESFEFWQQRADRLHDRLRYRRREDGAWLIERLAP
jgi:pyridoxamine 5'-phosphate oxidase